MGLCPDIATLPSPAACSHPLMMHTNDVDRIHKLFVRGTMGNRRVDSSLDEILASYLVQTEDWSRAQTIAFNNERWLSTYVLVCLSFAAVRVASRKVPEMLSALGYHNDVEQSSSQ